MVVATGSAASIFFAWFMYKNTIFYGKLLMRFNMIVDTGHRAIKFNKIFGIKEGIFREGWHIRWPYFERPIIYDVRTHPTVIKSMTGSKGKCSRVVVYGINRLTDDKYKSESAV